MFIVRFLCSIAADKFGLMANISPKIKRVLVFFVLSVGLYYIQIK